MSEQRSPASGLLLRAYYKLWRSVLRLQLTALRAQGASIHPDVRIYGRVTCQGDRRNLRIGAGTTLNQGVFLGVRDRLTIGRDVHISPYAQVHTGYLVPDEIPRYHRQAPIVIHDHAWIASGAIVGGGVTVGRAALVAAGAVVTSDVPEATMVGGVPARVVRQLDIHEADPSSQRDATQADA